MRDSAPDRAKILGTGSAVPKRIMTNADLEREVETSDSWITARTGIKERRVAQPGTAASDLGAPAALEALEAAGLGPEDVDCILVGSLTPDMFFPSTACFIQQKIGAVRAAAFDLSAACSGFLYGLGVARGFIESGHYRHVLVIGAEILSTVVDWRDRSTCVLFGDGAGAAVVGPGTADQGILSTVMRADGRHADLIQLPGGGSRHPASPETLSAGLHYMKMKGREVFKTAVLSLSEVAGQALDQAGVTAEDVDLVIPHQANLRIIEALAKRVLIPIDRFVINIQHYGNTSAASIPLALDEAVRDNRLKAGDLVLLASFGGGLTYASAVLRW